MSRRPWNGRRTFTPADHAHAIGCGLLAGLVTVGLVLALTHCAPLAVSPEVQRAWGPGTGQDYPPSPFDAKTGDAGDAGDAGGDR